MLSPDQAVAEKVANATSQIAKDAWDKARQAGSLHDAAAVYAHELLEAVYRAEQRNGLLTRALEQIQRLPNLYGHFQGGDAATEAIRIAKEVLGS